MASKNFDLKKELHTMGFKPIAFPMGDYYNHKFVTAYERSFEKEIDVLWYGKDTVFFSVIVVIREDGSVWAEFSNGKCKEYTSPKRAYNAILETVENAGFEF